jgi:hypothetical protein
MFIAYYSLLSDLIILHKCRNTKKFLDFVSLSGTIHERIGDLRTSRGYSQKKLPLDGLHFLSAEAIFSISPEVKGFSVTQRRLLTYSSS